MASWMSARYQESYGTTRRWVESARALRERPALEEAYGNGEVSGDQMQALVTLTRPGADDDAVWLEQLAGRIWPRVRWVRSDGSMFDPRVSVAAYDTS